MTLTDTLLSATGSAFARGDFLKIVVIDGRPHWIAHVADHSVHVVPLSKWEQTQWKIASAGRRAKYRVLRWWDSIVLLFDREPE